MKKNTSAKSLPLFEGGKTELIYLRVPKTLLDTLESAAQKADQPLADYIRDLLSFHFIPEILKEKIEKGLVPDREDKALLESRSFKEYLGRLEEIARLVKKYRKTTTEMSKQSDSLTQLVEEKLAKVMDRVRKELKGGTK
jgi:sirohydrochlorin ferrochelatase